MIGNNYDIQSTTSLEEKLKFTILGTILRFSLIYITKKRILHFIL